MCAQVGCEQSAERFGAEQGYILDGGFVPNSADRAGLIMRATVSPQSRIRVAARMQSSERSEDVVGVGLALDPSKNPAAPELSVVISSQLSQAIVATGTKTLWSATIDVNAHDYQLDRDPDGTARLLIDGIERATLKIPLPEGELRAFVFGRAGELPTGARARIQRISIASARCDRISYWSERSSLLAVGAIGEAHGPSVIAIGEMRWLAYASGGTIRIVLARGDGLFEADRLTLPPGPDPFDRGGVADPEWVFDSLGLALYYTAIGADGLRSIGRANFADLFPSTAVTRAQILLPSAFGLSELFAPSVVLDVNGGRLLVVTATDRGGHKTLRLFRAEGSGVPVFEAADRNVLVGESRTRDASEFHVLGSADIVRHRGRYEVYFSAVYEAEWVTALLVSNDLSHWLSAGTVLQGPASGDGVLDPDVSVVGDVLTLHHTAYASNTQDTKTKTSWQLARASRKSSAICQGEDCGSHADCAPLSANVQCTCEAGYVWDAKRQCIADTETSARAP